MGGGAPVAWETTLWPFHVFKLLRRLGESEHALCISSEAPAAERLSDIKSSFRSWRNQTSLTYWGCFFAVGEGTVQWPNGG